MAAAAAAAAVVVTVIVASCAADQDIVSAHKEIRSRLTYEVGVRLSQKERKADKERRLRQRQHLNFLSDHETDLQTHITFDDAADAAVAADAAHTAADVHASDAGSCADADADAGVVQDDNDQADFDDISFQCAATAATDVAAADTSHQHWGKNWITAAASAEKGEINRVVCNERVCKS